MKNIFKIAAVGCVSLISLAGCQTNFDDINTNPNSPETVPTPYLLTTVERNIAYYFYDQWSGVRISGVTAQHWAQRNYTDEDRYQYRTNTTNTCFEDMYVMLNDAQSIIDMCRENPDGMSAYGDPDLQIASAMLIKAFGLQMLSEMFGGIPYSEALKYNSFEAPGILTPKYDTQQEVFANLESDIREAQSLLKGVLDRGGKGWTSPISGSGTADKLLGGDPENWYRFANTMLLRLAVRQSNVKADWKTMAMEAINAGIIEDNSGNASFKFIGGGAPGDAPIYNMFITSGRNDFTMSYAFASFLKGETNPKQGYTSPLAGFRDPRFNAMIGEANLAAGNVDGLPYGLVTNDNQIYVENNLATLINFYRQSGAPVVSQATFWTTFIDCANAQLLKAEVTGDVADFRKGVEASMAQWGVSDAAYVQKVCDMFTAADDEGKRELCVTQKYIHNFAHNSMEAWSEYRRTGYPSFLIKPGDVTAVINGQNYIFTPIDASITEITARMTFATSEYTRNRKNLQVAIDNLGGPDAYSTKLFWAKK